MSHDRLRRLAVKKGMGIPVRRKGYSVLRNVVLTALILAAATLICLLLRQMDEGDIYVSMIFLLAVAVVARITDGFVYGIAASVIGVLGVNFAFTKPYFKFCLSLSGYPLAFLSMLAVSVTTSAMTTQIKRQEEQHYRAELEEMRANLLRAVSHDLRTPLTSISGVASVLVSQPDMPVENRQRLLREIADDSEWLIRMVENLLSITRINAQPANLHKNSEAAEEIISEAVRKFRKRFPEMPVEIALPEELLLVPMDPILIEQVLGNLMENAVLHAQTATRIQVRLTQEGDSAVFEVSDDGVGVEPKRLKEIFDAVSTSDDGRGMGIGLSVCKAIILAHGGDIEASNRAGGGACFRFRLPMKEENHESDDYAADRRG